MASFRKPRKNFRARMTESEEEEGAERGGMEPMEVVVQQQQAEQRKAEKKKKKEREEKERKGKQQSLLSFEEDFNQADDGEVFQVKKSVQSRKLAKQLERERKKKKGGGGGDALGLPAVVQNVQVLREANGSRQKVAEEQKPVVMEVDDDDDEDDEDQEEEEEDEEEEIAKGGRLGEAQRRHAFNHPDNFRRILQSGEIPDAAMIHAARKRRQMAREMGSDFVPLKSEEGTGSGGGGQSDDEGRMLRDNEEDEEDEMSDEGQRITFADVDLRRKEKERRREAFLAAQEGSDGDQEEEDEEDWEVQQIRKAGLSGTQLPLVGDQYSASGKGQEKGLQPMHSAVPPSFAASLSNAAKGVQLTAEGMRHQLQSRLASLEEVHRRHVKDRREASEEADQCEADLEGCKVDAPRLARRFAFYQELRGYVTDLVECLDEKVPLVEAAEERMISLLEDRNRRLIQRRRQDVQDQVDEFTPLRRMTSGLPPPDTIPPPQELEARTRRAAEREGRRTRRRRARESSVVGSSQPHQEGLSSDDEETEVQLSSFASEQAQIMEDASLIMVDVEDEFSSVGVVASRFESWKGDGKTGESEVYCQAYVSLCLPRILAPLARLQMVGWNPSAEGDQDLEALGWYRSLLLFGLRAGETEEGLGSDPDRLLLPRLVLRVVLPKITQLVKRVWDPCSRSQSLRLVRMVRRLVREVPLVCGGALSELLKAVAARLAESADADVFVMLLSHAALEKSAPARAFHRRLFWSGAKLLGNVLAWQGVLSDKTLRELALGAVLNRSLLVSLRTNPSPHEALAGASGLVAYLPRAWLPPHCSPTPEPGSPPTHSLQPLVTFLQGLQAQPAMQDKPYKEQLAALIRTVGGTSTV